METSEDYLRAVTIGGLTPRTEPVRIEDYDPEWPVRFAREAASIAAALGDRALRIEHAGSTSVPDLPAKPIIDIVLAVPNSADESAYAQALEQAGYALHIREPEWHEHRLFRPAGDGMNLHVFSAGCSEIDRMLAFRDWLRGNAEDRALYAETKRALARQTWKYTQNYADAKSAVVEQIMTRALAHATSCGTSSP
jgi:GrpB-like predicted nucleotidyltransferase (UPF0157 family)